MNSRKSVLKLITNFFIKNEDHVSFRFQELEDERDRRFARALAFGVLKHAFELDEWLNLELLQKPLKDKEASLRCLLLIGLYQVRYMDIPDHAVVNETVKLERRDWKRRLANAVLRKAVSHRKFEPVSEEARWNHPAWLIEAIQRHYPEHWKAILRENNHAAPNTLRLTEPENFQEWFGGEAERDPLIESACHLKYAQPLESLPGYEDGEVFAQDTASQLTPSLLQVETGHRVLDACSAPGGKACHLGLFTKDLTCLEVEPKRIQRLRDNLERARVRARIIEADAATYSFEPAHFDRILLDAPCSATGVIRRHPDIKHRRQARDIEKLVQTQSALLENLWPALKPGGRLLYATCSVLPDENESVIAAFLEKHSDAVHLPIDAEWGIAKNLGRQILPGPMDGFYYCLIEKEC